MSFWKKTLIIMHRIFTQPPREDTLPQHWEPIMSILRRVQSNQHFQVPHMRPAAYIAYIGKDRIELEVP